MSKINTIIEEQGIPKYKIGDTVFIYRGWGIFRTVCMCQIIGGFLAPQTYPQKDQWNYLLEDRTAIWRKRFYRLEEFI